MKLPLNCSVEYYSSFLTRLESIELYKHLVSFKELTSMHKMTTVTGESFYSSNGKLMFITNDLFEEKAFPESIWGCTMVWSEEMKLIKERIENFTSQIFDVCVCIYYPDGNSGVAYHSDLVAFGDTSLIPSLSLGEEREFSLREKQTLKEHKMILKNGSLIIMGENCQERYEHSLPEHPKYKQPRINLTFRKYGFS